MTTWNIVLVLEVELWVESLDQKDRGEILRGLQILEQSGPQLGRPLVDSIRGSLIKNLKVLLISRGPLKQFRLLFVYDPERNALILVGGNKSGDWSRWYKNNIEIAEINYLKYLDGMN